MVNRWQRISIGDRVDIELWAPSGTQLPDVHVIPPTNRLKSRSFVVTCNLRLTPESVVTIDCSKLDGTAFTSMHVRGHYAEKPIKEPMYIEYVPCPGYNGHVNWMMYRENNHQFSGGCHGWEPIEVVMRRMEGMIKGTGRMYWNLDAAERTKRAEAWLKVLKELDSHHLEVEDA